MPTPRDALAVGRLEVKATITVPTPVEWMLRRHACITA
jgi:hypothetical protein